MRLYLIGPMSGIKSFNYPAFEKAAAFLRGEGFEVQSPTHLDSPETFAAAMASPDGNIDQAVGGLTYEDFVAKSLARILLWKPDALVALPDWEESTGATREHLVGKAWGIPTFPLDSYDPILGFPVEHNGVAVYDAAGHWINYEDNPLRQRSVTGGVKDNRGKSRVELIPFNVLMRVGHVLGFGAQKYKEHNWRLGLSWSDTIGSALHHVFAFAEGEDFDAESGACHVDNAICQLMFLSEYYHTKTGTDDRWVSADKEAAKA